VLQLSRAGDGASSLGSRQGYRCCSPRQTRGGGEAATWAWVQGEDTRDLPHGDELPVGEIVVERSGVPYAALPRGEHLRKAAVLGGEEGDDLTKDGIMQEEDAVNELFCYFQPSPHHSGDHPHGRTTTCPAAAGIGE
jgi:hypothetical protein